MSTHDCEPRPSFRGYDDGNCAGRGRGWAIWEQPAALSRIIDELTAGAVDLAGFEDPLDVLVGGFIPQFEARGSTEALAMVLAIGSVAQGRAGKAASAAADRLVQAGIPGPGWAAELGEPVRVADCWRIIDAQGTASMLACSFHRAGRSHAVVMSVDHRDCGAATGIVLLGMDPLPETLEMMRAGARDGGCEITQEALDPAEWRWQVEAALDAWAVHDNDARGLGLDDVPVDEDGLPDYRALAVLLRARMNAVPGSGKPTAPHGTGMAGVSGYPSRLSVLAELLTDHRVQPGHPRHSLG
jgi:hypothetical protein